MAKKLKRDALGILVAGLSLLAHAASPVDATQAETMLRLLERCHAGGVPAQAIDEVMDLPGTRLIVGQQNVSRRVTPAQYRAVLTAACGGEIARIAPSEPGSRAEKGVQGLTEDVGPSLIWGRDHVELLKQRLVIAQQNEGLDEVVPLALKNPPERIDLAPKLYVVMGGRAGAAASDDGIYVDLLADAWRSRASNAAMTPHEMVEFFAHETHHVGYGRMLDREREQLHLTAGEAQAWNFLTAVMMEGSATLLINGHGSWAELQKQRHIQADLTRLPQLLPAAGNILQAALAGGMSDREYQTKVSEFFNEGYHATGAKLLYVIEEARGRDAVLRVMKDPRSLLVVYNECAAEKKEPFRFDPALADAVKVMGGADPRPAAKGDI
jgi:putative zinc-dependent peptidase DUF5700